RLRSVSRSVLQKLDNAAVIFCTAGPQSNRNEVLGRSHASRNTIQILFNRLYYCSTLQFVSRQQELNWPVRNDDVLILHSAASRFQMLINARQAHQRASRFTR